ncbi:MAG: FAD-dependent oxidoreductase [Clostridia bacterium]|nr:FAD-dependent oxidoreductase [Clostridia bacterium]
MDIHNPEGTGTTLYYFNGGEYYKIPYRSLLPKEYDNLLVAGRCLSATHEAHSAVRIMPICACLGQAAGIAVAVAMKSGADTHSVDVGAVRLRLRETDAVVD